MRLNKWVRKEKEMKSHSRPGGLDYYTIVDSKSRPLVAKLFLVVLVVAFILTVAFFL